MEMGIALFSRALFTNGLGRAVIVLAAAAGFALAATPAWAQCADPDDAAEDVYDLFYDEVGEDFFGIGDEDICDKLTKTVVKACRKAVSDSAKCYVRVYKSVLSGQKTACSNTGDEKSDCNEYYKDRNEAINSEIDFEEQEANQDCEDYAGDFWDYCFSGIN